MVVYGVISTSHSWAELVNNIKELMSIINTQVTPSLLCLPPPHTNDNDHPTQPASPSIIQHHPASPSIIQHQNEWPTCSDILPRLSSAQCMRYAMFGRSMSPYQSESNILMVLEMSTKHDHKSLSPIPCLVCHAGEGFQGILLHTAVHCSRLFISSVEWDESDVCHTPGNIFIVQDD